MIAKKAPFAHLLLPMIFCPRSGVREPLRVRLLISLLIDRTRDGQGAAAGREGDLTMAGDVRSIRRAAVFRARANEARATAELITRQDLRATMLELAQKWDAMAEKLERRLAANSA